MRGTNVMNIQPLDESWQVVLVVTSANVDQMSQTLEDMRAKSLRHRASILAQDTPFVRQELSGCPFPIVFKLPAKVEANCHWASVVSAHEFVAHRTLFLQAGTRVPECWDARLIAAGQRAERASAISPQSARHPILSVFASTDYQPELSVDEVDQWLNDYVEGLEYTVPVILESCALLQGNYWRDRALPIANDRELFEDLRAHGASLLATDQLYVDDFNVKNVFDVDCLPRAYLDACAQRPALAGTHHALRELSRRHERPAVMKSCLPVQLHVGHSWGGGLGRWMEDFTAADTTHNHLVLRSIGDLTGFGQTIALYRSTALDIPIRSWTLAEPIVSINMASYEYLGIIEELVSLYNVESVVVSSLVGHSMDILRTSLPTTVVLHDFFPFCPALYATFGSPCLSCSDSELRACAKDNPKNSYFKFESHGHWLAIRREFVRLIASQLHTVIAPSQSVVDRYRQLEFSLAEKRIHVVPHGLDAVLAQSLAPVEKISDAEPTAESRLKIVMLGRLTEEKGRELLSDVMGKLCQFADVYLLGTGESGAPFSSYAGVTIRESYDRSELGGLFSDVRPDLGMLLSNVPETFSYTLSELWAAGIPVLATRLGAFADRIVDSDNGWLVEPHASAVLDKLRDLNVHRTLLERAKHRVAQQPVRTTSQMVREYALAMPESTHIPAGRFNLPRRTYQNPYRSANSGLESAALYINYQRSYRQVLAAFLRYTSRKMQQSPKLPRRVRQLAGRTFQWTAGYLER